MAPLTASDCLDTAMAATRWLDAQALPQPEGLAWPLDPAQPRLAGPMLFQGNAGVAMAYLATFHASPPTAERDHLLNQARRASDYLVHWIDSAAVTGSPLGPGLYDGVAGIAFALWETHRATGDAVYGETAMVCLDAIVDAADEVGAGVQWTDTITLDDGREVDFPPTDVMGGIAGIGLFLLYAERTMRPGLLDLALAGGRRLVELAEHIPEGSAVPSLTWRTGNPGHHSLMPNFSHGGAGAGYFLARLHEATGDQGALLAAEAAGRYLQSAAAGGPSACVVPRFLPARPLMGPEYGLGWCHGPQGPAMLFAALAPLTADPQWEAWLDRSLTAYLPGRFPARLADRFAASRTWCHGSAGNAVFMLWAEGIRPGHGYGDEAERLLEQVVSSGLTLDGGLAWNEDGMRAGEVASFPQCSLSSGAAGVAYGLSLAAAMTQGAEPVAVLPDWPRLEGVSASA